jgi:hypothetical protein
LTGKTKVKITGDGFIESGIITVRFNYGKGHQEVAGTYVSE